MSNQEQQTKLDGGASVSTAMLERMATDCGGRLVAGTRETEGFSFSMRDLAAFVAAVEKREREACATWYAESGWLLDEEDVADAMRKRDAL